jgi:hypothetical protein
MPSERKRRIAAGTDTQIIYNSNGLETGSANLTFDGTKLTVPTLGTSTTTVTGLTVSGTATINSGVINALSATGTVGFYGTAPVSQPAAVADLTVTATTGTLPTPAGAVTIADADVPTVAELQEFCVEINAKVVGILEHLRTLGLIET